MIMAMGLLTYTLVNAFADNSTRDDWGGDETNKYCTKTEHEVTIYPNGTQAGKFTKTKWLCLKGA